MYYEINIAKNGRHYFATAPRSLQSEPEARKMYQHFKELFPCPEYSISVTRYDEGGVLENFEPEHFGVVELQSGQPSRFWNKDLGWVDTASKATLLHKDKAEEAKKLLLTPRIQEYQATGRNYQEVHISRLIDDKTGKPIYV